MSAELTVADELWLASLHDDVRALVHRVVESKLEDVSAACPRCRQFVPAYADECIHCGADLTSYDLAFVPRLSVRPPSAVPAPLPAPEPGVHP